MDQPVQSDDLADEAAAVVLALFVAYWLELDDAFWAGITAAVASSAKLSLWTGSSMRQSANHQIYAAVCRSCIAASRGCSPRSRLGVALPTTWPDWGAPHSGINNP